MSALRTTENDNNTKNKSINNLNATACIACEYRAECAGRVQGER